MRGEQPEPMNPKRDLMGFLGLLTLVNECVALTHLAAFTIPGTAGYRIYNWQALLGALGVFFFAGCFQDQGDISLVSYYFWLQIGLFILHRVATASAIRKGKEIHSDELGLGYLQRLLPASWDRGFTRGFLEIVAAVGICYLLAPYCLPLAIWIAVASVSSYVVYARVQARDHRAMELWTNQKLEGQHLADLYRRGEEE